MARITRMAEGFFIRANPRNPRFSSVNGCILSWRHSGLATLRLFCQRVPVHAKVLEKGFILLGTWLLLLFTLAAGPLPNEDVPPPWAYPVDPPGLVAPKDDGTLRRVPESALGFTLSQVRDGFVSPDWHPHDHPPLPEIVAHGRKPEVMACGYCHRAPGTGGPEYADLARLPAGY